MCIVFSQVIKFYLFFNNSFLTDNKFHAVFELEQSKENQNYIFKKQQPLKAHKSNGVSDDLLVKHLVTIRMLRRIAWK